MAKLPCNLTPPSSQDRVSLVIWYKDENKVPIYSVDVRGRALEVASHWADDKSLGGRGHYSAEYPMSYLTLEAVQEVDAGRYKCRVDFRFSPTRNSFVNLTVIVPPRKLTLLEANGGSLQRKVVGPVTEGSGLQLTCIAIGGRPTPRVSWWKDGVLIDDTDEALSERRVKNVLSLERLERRHLGTLLTCKATNNDMIAPLSTTVTVDLYLDPLEAKIIGDKGPLSASQEYEIPCQTFGSRPSPVITWWKSGKKIQSNIRESISADGNVTTSILTFIPQINDSGQTLSCRVNNPHLPSTALEDFLSIVIHYVPIVSLELGSSLNASSIREGMDVYFDCSIQAFPWVRRITWMHNGEEVDNNANKGRIITNQTLVLQAVSRDDAGHYSCIASNSEGDSESKPFNLDIKFEPQCKASQQRVYGAARSEEITVTCGVDANPPALWFRWSFNNSAVRTRTIESFEAGGGRSVATYKPIHETDYGTLLCWGRNSLGSQSVPCVFHIVPAGKPDVPHNCSMLNRSQTWIHVQCGRGFDGGLPQFFVLELHEGQGEDGYIILNMTNRNDPDFTIKDLEPGTTYSVIIYANNGKGRSANSKVLRVATLGHTVHEHHRTLDSELTGLDPVLIVAALAGTILLLLIVIIVVLIRRKRRSHMPQDRTSDHELGKSRTELLTVLPSTEDDRNPDVVPNTNVGCIVNSQYMPEQWEEQRYLPEPEPQLPPDKAIVTPHIQPDESSLFVNSDLQSIRGPPIWRGDLRNAETQTQTSQTQRHKESAV